MTKVLACKNCKVAVKPCAYCGGFFEIDDNVFCDDDSHVHSDCGEVPETSNLFWKKLESEGK